MTQCEFLTPVMVAPDEAEGLICMAARPRRPRRLPIEAALGLTLAEPLRADRDCPPFPRAMMDGYAVRLASAGKTIAVLGEIAAGESCETPVRDDACLAIATGACCPPGTEAVVQKEHARCEGEQVTLPPRVLPGRHIAAPGSECAAGRLIAGSGQRITGLMVAAMAAVGCREVQAVPRPSAAVVTTGGELVSVEREPGRTEIRDSNGPMMAAMLKAMNVDCRRRVQVPDRREAILRAVEEANDCDLVLLSGGVSVGSYDLVPDVMQQYGAEPVFHKVRQKPGKPLLLARNREQLLFGLPGNPLAAHLCMERYVRLAIGCMEGRTDLPSRSWGRLTAGLRPRAGRTYFMTAVCEPPDAPADAWRLSPVFGASSADVFTTCRANGYIVVPPGREDHAAGDILEFFRTCPL